MEQNLTTMKDFHASKKMIKKIVDPKYSSLLFWLCWLAYTVTYIGRLNYNASIAEILVVESITKEQAGLISTGAFITYGAGQMINGILGDRISPKWMMMTGLTLSAVVNICMGVTSSFGVMLVLWSINGFLQSMTWCPIIKLFADYLQQKRREKALVNISTCVPVGTLLAYALSALLIALFSWRAVFFVAAVIMLATAAIWMVGVTMTEKHSQKDGVVEEETQQTGAQTQQEGVPFYRLMVMSGLMFIGIGIVMHGILKDGVTTWVPTFLSETFQTPAALSIFATTLLPIVNLAGVYGASWLNRKVFRNEALTSAACFGCAVAAVLILMTLGGKSFILSLAMLAVTTSAMLGVNTMTISLMPMYFAKMGKASTASGTLNSMAYLGSAISSYATGAIAYNFGWTATMAFWLGSAAVGVLLCGMFFRKWDSFVRSNRAKVTEKLEKEMGCR